MKQLLLAISLLCAAFVAQAQEDFKITHGPYLCNPSQEGVEIMWTTSLPALSWVEIAPNDGTHFYAFERPKYYASKAGRKLANKTVHHVSIEGLQPGTTYRYRVVSREVSEWNTGNKVYYKRTASSDVYRKKPLQFSTLSNQADTCTFIVYNDVHGKSAFMKDLSKNIDFSAVNFILLNGDMANHLESESQLFSDYIDALVEMAASQTPLFYTRGNHETRGLFADELINYFPTKDGNFYQFFTVGKTGFLILDCGEDKPDSDIEYNGLSDFDRYREKEAKWLEKVTASAEFQACTNRIAILHIPMAGKSLWHGNVHLQQTLLPILNKAGIKVMLSGHTHRYAYHPSEPGVMEFPNLINSNSSYLKCKVKGETIQIEVIGEKGVLQQHTFK